MPKQFNPTNSRDIFVGREKELNKVRGLLSGSGKKWIIQLTGDGGIGKTRFLHRLYQQLHQEGGSNGWLVPEIIDFFKPTNHTAFGLLNEVAIRIGIKHFDRFVDARKRHDEVLRSQPDAARQQESFEMVARAFFDDLRELLLQGQRILLLFDTCEESRPIADWLRRRFILRINDILSEIGRLNKKAAPEVTPNLPALVILFAGRTPVAIDNKLEKCILPLELGGLKKAEMKEFFRQVALYPNAMTNKQCDALFVRCGGRPLYVALSYDWLHNQMGTIDQLLENDTPFQAKLVDWILKYRSDESDVILASALAWRRMEPGLLARLQRVSKAKAQALFEQMQAYCFVKYRPPDTSRSFPGSFQLHDVMRDFVNEHVWPREGQWTRQAMLDLVLEWYTKRIGEPPVIDGKERPKSDEVRSLLTEFLYYRMERDITDGSRYGETLFKIASRYMDLALCDLYNAEIARFEDRLPEDRRDQLRFQQALVAFRREDYRTAREYWNFLIRQPSLDRKLYATCHMMLVELEAYNGNCTLALKHADTAEKHYLKLLQDNEGNPKKQSLLRKELGQLYNNWGYAFRTQSNWEMALNNYIRALAYLQAPKHIARTLNNIGFIHYKRNAIDQALAYVQKALSIREQLGIHYELGLGYNTMGMLKESLGRYNEASQLYRKARIYFELAFSRRGLALVQINLGRILRITGALDEALEFLQEAEEVLREKNDKTYLIHALREIGYVYRQRGTERDLQKAKEYVEMSLELSNEIEDKRAKAENLEDLSMVYYDWAKIVRPRDRRSAEKYLSETQKNAREAADIAKDEAMPFLLAKVEQTNGEIAFDRRQYKKAFESMFRACELISGQLRQPHVSPFEYQRQLAELADRLQERLQTLPKPGQTLEFAQTLMERIESEPQEIRQNLSLLQTKLQATIELSNLIQTSMK